VYGEMATSKQTARHGTTTRYRHGCRCDRCRSANAKAKSAQRARARQRGATPVLSLVPDVQPSSTTDTTPEPPAKKTPGERGGNMPTAWGRTEKALEEDLKSVDQTTPFFQSLRFAALVLAREIDDSEGKGSKAPLVKQLVDTIREIKGKDVNNGNSFAELLEGLAQPLVAPAANRNRKKSS
jgi:hypothetical protein